MYFHISGVALWRRVTRFFPPQSGLRVERGMAPSDRHRGINIEAHWRFTHLSGTRKPSETRHCSGFVAANRPSLFRLFTAVVTGWSQMWTCHVGRPGFVIYHLWSVMKGRSFRGKCCKCFLIARKVERNQTRKSNYCAKQSPFFLKAQRDFVLKPCCKKHRLGSCVNGSRDRYSGESVSPICLLET